MRIHHHILPLVLLTSSAACVSSSDPAPDQQLRIGVPGATLIDGWNLWTPDERTGDSRASDPSYVYLTIGEDAVLLPGPVLTVDTATADAIFADADPAVTWQVTDLGYAGLTVVVADTLTYRFDIEDYEDEVHPIRVDLERYGDEIHSYFVLAADDRDGIDFNSTITATLDGVTTTPTGPWTLEARPVAWP